MNFDFTNPSILKEAAELWNQEVNRYIKSL